MKYDYKLDPPDEKVDFDKVEADLLEVAHSLEEWVSDNGDYVLPHQADEAQRIANLIRGLKDEVGQYGPRE